jgi:hypothetical protein
MRPAQSGARRGAFVTVSDAESEGSGPSRDQHERPRAKAGVNENKRSRTGTFGGCWGCGQRGHTLGGCFFMDPKKRSEGWKPIEFIRSIWLRNKKIKRLFLRGPKEEVRRMEAN